MLYEMIAVVRVGKVADVKDIVRMAGNMILSSGGVIRGITNWGPYLLAKPKVRAQVLHDSGHHVIMRFDCSPKAQEMVRKSVAIDPRMLRCGVVKLGGTLKEIMNVPGEAAWRRHPQDSDLMGEF
ncbi:hypothetical protein MMC07_000547 [Pseudocyphellaria aurata]|nr:hypothetical protein [Pseudocyphellaria aurata]